jgi:DNA-binding NarL/FixJ family response regulator
MNKPLTIVNVEDKDRNLALISEFLDKDTRFKLLAQVHSGKDALRICAELVPDIVIVDADITDMEHIELIREIHKICPKSLRLISVREFHSVDETEELSKAGVRGFAFKQEDIISHLRSAEQEEYTNAVARGSIALERVLSIVLCYDDDGFIANHYKYLTKILANYSYFKLLAQAHSGKDALIICPATHPDFIIVDINVPDMTLLELVTQLIELCPTSTIITASISDSADYMQEMMLAGVRYFLQKPFDEWVVHHTLISIDRYRRQNWT